MFPSGIFSHLPSISYFFYFARIISSWLIFTPTEHFLLFLLCSDYFFVAHFHTYRAFLTFSILLGLFLRGSFSLLPSISSFFYFARIISSWLIFTPTEHFLFLPPYSVYNHQIKNSSILSHSSSLLYKKKSPVGHISIAHERYKIHIKITYVIIY